MRFRLRAVFLCLFALSCVFLASSALVERPVLLREVQAESDTLPQTDAQAALAAPSKGLAEDATGGETLLRVQKTRASALCQTTAAACAQVRETDVNGVPLRARSYVRAVYRAFPPEGMPG